MKVLLGVIVCTMVLLLSLRSCAAGNTLFNVHLTVLINPVKSLSVCRSLKQAKLCKTGILTCMRFTLTWSKRCYCQAKQSGLKAIFNSKLSFINDH